MANEAINAFAVECPAQMHDLVHGHDGSTAIRRPVALVEKYAPYKRARLDSIADKCFPVPRPRSCAFKTPTESGIHCHEWAFGSV